MGGGVQGEAEVAGLETTTATATLVAGEISAVLETGTTIEATTTDQRKPLAQTLRTEATGRGAQPTASALVAGATRPPPSRPSPPQAAPSLPPSTPSRTSRSPQPSQGSRTEPATRPSLSPRSPSRPRPPWSPTPWPLPSRSKRTERISNLLAFLFPLFFI